MGVLDWLTGTDPFCRGEFKTVFSGFIDAVTDSAVARGPVVAPPRPHGAAPARHRLQLPPAKRLVAFGDVHGDLAQMRKAFRAAKLVDEDFRWAGGDTVAVQVGDQLDRGDEEIEILYALERLAKEARHAGGALHVLNGNHETMNVAADMRYGTRGACVGLQRMEEAQELGTALKRRCGCAAGWSAPAEQPRTSAQTYRAPEDASAQPWAELRARVFQPGSVTTRRFFSEHAMVLQVGSSLFVHAGLHPEHVDMGLGKINSVAQDWMENSRWQRQIPSFVRSRNAVVWTREYSHNRPEQCDCGMLEKTLRMAGAERMVVGHTIQRLGVNGACDGRVLRVDVGMSQGCGYGSPQALEVIDDRYLFRILEDGRRVPINPAASQLQPPPPPFVPAGVPDAARVAQSVQA